MFKLQLLQLQPQQLHHIQLQQVMFKLQLHQPQPQQLPHILLQQGMFKLQQQQPQPQQLPHILLQQVMFKLQLLQLQPQLLLQLLLLHKQLNFSEINFKQFSITLKLWAIKSKKTNNSSKNLMSLQFQTRLKQLNQSLLHKPKLQLNQHNLLHLLNLFSLSLLILKLCLKGNQRKIRN